MLMLMASSAPGGGNRKRFLVLEFFLCSDAFHINISILKCTHIIKYSTVIGSFIYFRDFD